MSSIVTDQGIVHYETYGYGSPVILLHGWIGSWGLWEPTMRALGRNYRCYALDFWGFGESGKKRDSYAVSDFMELVKQFMDALGIASAPLIGHSMGGTTSLGTTIRYPDRVTKVCVIGSPITGTSLSIFLQLAGVRWIGSIVRNMPTVLQLGIKVFAPFITRDKRWYGMVSRDISRTTVDSFFSSIGSLRRTDLRSRLSEIRVPTMGVYGLRDVIVNPKQHEQLKSGVGHARIEVMPQSGHFPMLDEPDKYLEIIRSFLDTPVPSNAAALRAAHILTPVAPAAAPPAAPSTTVPAPPAAPPATSASSTPPPAAPPTAPQATPSAPQAAPPAPQAGTPSGGKP